MAGTQQALEIPVWDSLVQAGELAPCLGAADLCILDCRHDLAHPALGLEQYRAGHIPGALHAHLDHDLSGPRTAHSGRHPLPEPAILAGRLGAWGIGTATQVVCYDASEGAFAARAWWLLRWLGHGRVAVLDGGLPRWVADGQPVATQAPTRPARRFTPAAPLQGLRTLDEVAALSAALRAGDSTGLLVDARAADRYEGRNETIDPAAGHIPGAVNRFWKTNLGADGRFKTSAALRAEYEALLAGRRPAQVTLQCGSGVTACHDLLALHRAGLQGAALFPGSWSQWVADPLRPVATGPQP